MERLPELIAAILGIQPSDVTDELGVGSPGWDSLSHMEIITAIEGEFSIDLDGDEIADMVNVAAIKAAIERHLG